jgi:hypothetical protein
LAERFIGNEEVVGSIPTLCSITGEYMKFALMFISILLFATSAMAALTATWEPNPPFDNVLYYTLYIDGTVVIGGESVYDTTVVVDLPNGITKGEHYGTVTATNIDGESVHSDQEPFNYGVPGKPIMIEISR